MREHRSRTQRAVSHMFHAVSPLLVITYSSTLSWISVGSRSNRNGPWRMYTGTGFSLRPPPQLLNGLVSEFLGRAGAPFAGSSNWISPSQPPSKMLIIVRSRGWFLLRFPQLRCCTDGGGGGGFAAANSSRRCLLRRWGAPLWLLFEKQAPGGGAL